MSGQQFSCLKDILLFIREQEIKFYVYVIKTPEGVPFYVGKGKGRRVAMHERYAASKQRGKHLSVIRSILRRGLSPLYELAASFVVDQEALAYEVTLIRQIGRKDLGFGPLLNATDGGQGMAGRSFSAETRRKISEKVRAAAPRLSESRSLQLKKQMTDPEFIRKQKESEPKRKQRIAETLATDEHRLLKSEHMRRVLSDNPALLAQRLEHLERLRNDPDAKERHREACREARRTKYPTDPATKERHREACRAARRRHLDSLK